VDYVLVHYQSPSGVAAASRWEQNGRDELLAFVRAAAARMNGGSRLLGVLSASLSAGLAGSRYSFQGTRLIWKDGLWWRSTGSEARALRLVPRSLRLWVDALEAAA
jgi:hypothetical protein